MVWFYIFVLIHVSLITILALNISCLRISLQVANGDGGNITIKKAVRAHLNCIEHSLPFGLVVLALALNTPLESLPALVIAFAIVRILHAYSMLSAAFNLRRIAAVSTYLLEISSLFFLAMKVFAQTF